jgi:23S rRNA (guanine2445-N2)-methyltransferase / 23S rRNA (guanine2069-N7)-methyltransferase
VSRFTAVVARGLEEVLATELRGLSATTVEVLRGAVAFEGDMALGYRACVSLRTASRVLLPLARFATGGPDVLYEGARSVRWADHLRDDGRLWIDCVAAAGVEGHTHFLAQKTKDAVCDQLRERRGVRPSVDRAEPDVRIHVHLGREHTTVSVDLGGSALHRRGYRASGGGEAPLKETLAAGVLLIAGWPERAARGEPLVDPLCGSGTLLIEGALIARDVAPGLLRVSSSTPRWLGHDAGALAAALDEARARVAAARDRPLHVVGFDASGSAVDNCLAAARQARVAEHVRATRCELASVAAPAELPPGLVVTNPPYGARLGETTELLPLYERLGDVLRRRFVGYTACVLTGSAVLARHLGLRPRRRHPLWNGPIECRLLEFPIASEAPRSDAAPGWRKPSAEAASFENRLRRNLRTLGGWAKREGVECYRLYDADVPEYNVAVDRYGTGVVVHEYAAPPSVPEDDAARRLRDALMVTAEVLGVTRESIVLKVRRRQVQGAQYQRSAEDAPAMQVHEGGLSFLVRLHGHIDTGLFCEQRLLRAHVAAATRGKTFLNLFAYTCTASVYAAQAGARRVTSVDLSARYLAWGRDNFAGNGLARSDARFVEDDCMAFLEHTRERFEVVLLNPPTYSRSHRMQGDFEVQRDHVRLIRAALARLDANGELYFATHARSFQLDAELRDELEVIDLSTALQARDFARQPFVALRLRHRN